MSKECILFFGEDWGRLNSTGQYLARALNDNYNIIWVNSIGLREPELNKNDITRIIVKLKDTISSIFRKDESIVQSDTKIIVLCPIAIPYLRFKIIRKINKIIVLKYLNRFFKKYNLNILYLITSCPATADIVTYIKAKKIIYYCADEYSELPGMNKKMVIELEQKLLQHSNMVFVTSTELLKEKRKINNNIYYLPHGVNYEHMRSSVDHDYDIPNDMKQLVRPLIGYIGLIGEHLDFDVIDYAAANIKNGTFVMVGPIESHLKNIPRNRNIVYLGSKKYELLPQYLKYFDVCILPWNRGVRNKYASPTKLREYLSAGCIVVSTDHPETYNVSNYIYISDSKESFLNNIELALKLNVNRNLISEELKNEDWAERADTLIRIVEKSH